MDVIGKEETFFNSKLFNSRDQRIHVQVFTCILFRWGLKVELAGIIDISVSFRGLYKLCIYPLISGKLVQRLGVALTESQQQLCEDLREVCSRVSSQCEAWSFCPLLVKGFVSAFRGMTLKPSPFRWLPVRNACRWAKVHSCSILIGRRTILLLLFWMETHHLHCWEGFCGVCFTMLDETVSVTWFRNHRSAMLTLNRCSLDYCSFKKFWLWQGWSPLRLGWIMIDKSS